MCVVDNGDVYCWSSTGFSVDLNINSNNITPTKIEKLSGSAKQAAVYNTKATCVVGSDTSLRCSGLGLDPDTVIFASGVTKVETIGFITCAIVNSGLKCWGYNAKGQLGDGTFTDRTTPVDVVGMGSGVTDVSVGHNTVCAIKNGAAYCWGSNVSGTIGDGTTNSSAVPVSIPTLSSGVTDISTTFGGYVGGEVPGDSSYAVKDGGLYVWGENDYGELGDGTTVDKLTPTLLGSFSSGVTQVDGGGIETCFLRNKEAYCFGLNENGQMGIPGDDLKYTPQKISGITGEILQIAAGSRRGCAATADKVYCWGYNADNVIETSTTDDQPIPKVVYTRK